MSAAYISPDEMRHHVLHESPILTIDQLIAAHPDLAEVNAQLEQFYDLPTERTIPPATWRKT